MRDIPGYEGLYAATSCGRIWSYKKQRFLKPFGDGHGYLKVDLFKDGIKKHCRVHRLIALTYLPNPENKPCINHIDENKTNNALPNLEWCTHEENNNHGSHNEKLSKAHQKKVICIETQEIFESVKEAAKAVDIDPSNISAACNGKHKTSAGYHWRHYYEEEKDD